MHWWCIDNVLMAHWLRTDDALMMHWWFTDDETRSLTTDLYRAGQKMSRPVQGGKSSRKEPFFGDPCCFPRSSLQSVWLHSHSPYLICHLPGWAGSGETSKPELVLLQLWLHKQAISQLKQICLIRFKNWQTIKYVIKKNIISKNRGMQYLCIIYWNITV